MKFSKIMFFLLFISATAFSFTDERHYSTIFATTRFFRVFTPIDYNPENSNKRYSVIYYFHGCGGSYERSGRYSYGDYGLTTPSVVDRSNNAAYEFANNADFENVATSKGVIIVSVDGKIDELPEGCKVYFPSLAGTWEGNYYNFSAYIRELIEVVDARYNTKVGPRFRAVTGLSMGGHMAIWVAATNPHLFSSASEFCHAPNFYDVGAPAYQTTIDLKELWRNFRGVPFRHSTTNRDYIRYYTDQLFSIYSGAGFENEYYLADYCHHAAARVDLQVDFHVKHFSSAKKNILCFSYLNLYPNFETWGYNVSSTKSGNGWIYLHNVTKNGLGIYTRKRLPWGNSLSEFDISVTTPANYTPNGGYIISRYSYCDDSFTEQNVMADEAGKLTISSHGGMGEEIGIIDGDLQPPVFILTDTINENIYLTHHVEKQFSADVINLSKSPQTVDFSVSTDRDELITIIDQPKQVTIPAQSKISIDSFATLKGNNVSPVKNVGYIKISSSIAGLVQDREHIIQVAIKNQSHQLASSEIKIFDGKAESISLFKYKWGEWDNPITSGLISEGSGNANGRVEVGEVFSIWIKPRLNFDSSDISTWHPTIPINANENADITVENIMHHSFSTGRDVLSANIVLNRMPTKDEPIRIPLQTEVLKVEYLEDDCHRNTADNFTYYHCEIELYADGTFKVVK